jgi:hypothetical protein
MARKPRMTKSEKAFVERISAIVFATPEIRNGQAYLDRKAFATLPDADRKLFIDLLIDKTR